MMNSIRTCRLVLALTFFLSSVAGMIGQESRGTISGTVLDPAGAAIPSANVTATEVRTGVKTPTKSDTSGHYNLPFLAPGEYEIEVAAPGFRSLVRRDITLASSDHPVIDIRLEIGQASQTVTVSGEA